MKPVISVLLLVLLFTLTANTVQAVSYQVPTGGWTYIYTGDAAVAGPTNIYDSLDGTWDHNSPSDQWDGTVIGAGRPGGVSALGGYIRLQDTGDPTDYGFADPGSNRKILFGHSITADIAAAGNAVLDNGVTISFRARIAKGAPVDNRYPDGGAGTSAWPAGGDGYVTHDGGKGNFSVRQLTGDKIISFALALASDDIGTVNELTGKQGLVMNKLNGNVPSEDVDLQGDESGTVNILELDPTQWHEFWITIQPDTLEITSLSVLPVVIPTGTHLVKVYKDGSLVPALFHVTAGKGNDYEDSYLGMGVASIAQSGAIDVDFFAYKSGIITPTPAPASPANDNCANATPVGNVTGLAFDTTHATIDGPQLCMGSPNIWYCYTAPSSGCVTISLEGSSFDTRLAVYDGCGCSSFDLLRCNDDFDYDSNKRWSLVTFPVTAGQQYLVEVGGFGTVTGQGLISIYYESGVFAPSNDNCWNASSVGDGSRQFDTRCASFDGPGHCINDSPNIWYRYTASCTGNVTVSLQGSSFDTMLAVYNTINCYPSISKLVDCNDDYYGRQSRVIFPAVAGHEYLIEVGGYSVEDTGTGVLNISCAGTPGPSTNDNCANAKQIGDVPNMSFDTTAATFDGLGHCMNSPNLWYCYTATCTGSATVSLCGSSFDTKLAVYNGCQCYPQLSSLIQCNDDYCSQQSQITFNTVAGQKYLIEVGGYGNATGTGVLNVTCQGQPGQNNDNCQNAKPVSDVPNLLFDTTQATFDGPPGHYITSPNLWYCYTAPCTGDVTVSLCGSSFDTKLAVYKGCQCYPQSGSQYAFNDDYCNLQSQVTFAATAGSQYLIEVGGYGSATGQGVLNISCAGPVKAYDLGDAPDSSNNFGKIMTAYPSGGPTGVGANYPTVFNDGSGHGPYGPIHNQLSAVACLGTKVTTENEADTGLDQDVTNNINPLLNTPNKDGGDDGVTVPINLPNCTWSTFDYTVNVVTPSELLFVNVWFDWNRDGDWDDTLTCSQGRPAPEWAVQNQVLVNLPVGVYKITTPAFLPWHPGKGAQQIWMRITLSEKLWWIDPSLPKVLGSGGSGPADGYEVGETEDYYFVPGTVSPSICEDLNGDGVIDYVDLNMLVNQWLGSCLQ